jgi:hypothetical protein
MKKEIAFQNNTRATEGLPFPIVLYPGFYGAFFGFQEKEDSEIVFCSCTKNAIQNYIKFQLSDPSYGYQSIDHKRYLVSSSEFPFAFSNQLINLALPENEDIIHQFRFRDNLCHECNKVIPSYYYCHKMYGSVFKQNYGWYIKKHAYDLGITVCVYPSLVSINTETCPEEIFEIIDIEPIIASEKYPEIVYFSIENIINSKIKRRILSFAEDEARLKFGHKKIGESWTNETILYEIIASIYPNFTIKKHYRPEFLNGLELDIFIKELDIGVEYQGIQHFQPIDHWGGKDGLEKLKKRDALKRKLCNSNNVRLIYFSYKDILTKENVLSVINPIDNNQ